MHNIVLISTKVVVHVAMYFAISCDEVTMINNQSWVNIHAYLVEGFKCIPIFLNLEILVDGGTTNYLTNVILKSLIWLMGA
jgi:hypothetical protein